jgi:hypothetical protein
MVELGHPGAGAQRENACCHRSIAEPFCPVNRPRADL